MKTLTKFLLPEKHQKQYRTLEDFRKKCFWPIDRLYSNFWPCADCMGIGRLVCFNKNEKMNETIVCNECKGAGRGSKEKLKERYKVLIEHHLLNIKLWEVERDMLRQIDSKINKGQVMVLQTLIERKVKEELWQSE